MNKEYLSDQKTQFNNKVVVVTGSTQGSGAETAKLFASRGAKQLLFVDVKKGRAKQLKSKLKQLDQSVFM